MNDQMESQNHLPDSPIANKSAFAASPIDHTCLKKEDRIMAQKRRDAWLLQRTRQAQDIVKKYDEAIYPERRRRNDRSETYFP